MGFTSDMTILTIDKDDNVKFRTLKQLKNKSGIILYHPLAPGTTYKIPNNVIEYKGIEDMVKVMLEDRTIVCGANTLFKLFNGDLVPAKNLINKNVLLLSLSNSEEHRLDVDKMTVKCVKGIGKRRAYTFTSSYAVVNGCVIRN